jgi:hypothetical protein
VESLLLLGRQLFPLVLFLRYRPALKVLREWDELFFFLSFNSAANICMYKAYFLLVEGPLEGPGLLLFGPPRGFLARLLKLRPQLGPLFLALGRLRAASI